MSPENPNKKNPIEEKINQLKIIGRFVSGDYNSMKIELNKGKNWSWDFKNNIISIPEDDLEEKTIEELKFSIGHEGSHRKITAGKMINKNLKDQNFHFLLNAIEDPRVNNYLFENYHDYKTGAISIYKKEFSEMTGKSKKDLGMIPKSIQAGFEYIKQWFYEINGKDFNISNIKDKDIKDILEKTLGTAQDVWWTYPSQQEADSQQSTNKYGDFAFDEIYKKIWPEFKKLVEQDQDNQETKKMLDDLKKEQENHIKQGKQGKKQKKQSKTGGQYQENQNNQDGQDNRQENQNNQGEQILNKLKGKLSNSQLQKLKEFLDNYESDSKEDTQKEKADKTNIKKIYDDLPEELKKKLKEIKDSLSQDKKDDLKKRARESLEKFQKEISKKLEGEFQKQKSKSTQNKQPNKDDALKVINNNNIYRELEGENKRILEKNNTKYREVLQEIYPLVNQLESQLKFILWQKQKTKRKSGFKKGQSISISRVISEKAKKTPPNQWKVFEKKEKPNKKDYIFSLLVDMSGSMNEDNKSRESFKSIVLFSEVLRRLKIPFEINGFNTLFYPLKGFEIKEINNKTQKEFEKILNPDFYTNMILGLEKSMENIKNKEEGEKIIFVISDGQHNHGGSESNLKTMVKNESDIKMIGLGLGENTEHVKNYFSNSIANINIEKLPNKLAELLKQILKK